MQGGGEQHSAVLCCSVIPTSLPARLLRPRLSHGRQKVALHFRYFTGEDVCVFVTDVILVEKISPFLTHIVSDGG